jgi:hypothetical protein
MIAESPRHPAGPDRGSNASAGFWGEQAAREREPARARARAHEPGREGKGRSSIGSQMRAGRRPGTPEGRQTGRSHHMAINDIQGWRLSGAGRWRLAAFEGMSPSAALGCDAAVRVGRWRCFCWRGCREVPFQRFLGPILDFTRILRRAENRDEILKGIHPDCRITLGRERAHTT